MFSLVKMWGLEIGVLKGFIFLAFSYLFIGGSIRFIFSSHHLNLF